MPTKDYQTDLLKRLANSEYAAQYLKAAFDETLTDGNKAAFLLALKNVVDWTLGKKLSRKTTVKIEKPFNLFLAPHKSTFGFMGSKNFQIFLYPFKEMVRNTS